MKLLYLFFSYISFRLLSIVEIKSISNVLFILISDCKKNIIIFFYLFDLFKSSLIIPVDYNSFQHYNNINLTNINFIINLMSRQIILIVYHFLCKTIKFVKISYLKFIKIILNTNLEIEIFIIYRYVQIKLVYYMLSNYILQSCLKVIFVSKQRLSMDSLMVVKYNIRETQNIEKNCYCK